MSVVLNAPVAAPALPKPRLTHARVSLTRAVTVCNEFGETSETQIPAERALTIYLDKKELVTLMTLGGQAELLVLGFLRNQRLIDSVDQIESITVDWSLGEGEMGEPGVAAVKTRPGAQVVVERSADRVVTTGCGQGSVFGDLMAHIDEPPPSYEEVIAMLRPGDILTHAFRPFPNSPATAQGTVKQAVLAARKRGVLFDIGHGGDQAVLGARHHQCGAVAGERQHGARRQAADLAQTGGAGGGAVAERAHGRHAGPAVRRAPARQPRHRRRPGRAWRGGWRRR